MEFHFILAVAGVVLLFNPTLCSDSVPSPITCLTRGADLLEDLQVVLCPPGCAQWRMSVFGTGPYASISNVCGAAIHSGAVGVSGGPLQVSRVLGRRSYRSSYSNGVQSQALSLWTSSLSLTKPVHIPLEMSSNTSTIKLPTKKLALKKKALKKPTVKKTIKGNPECQVELAVVVDSSRNLGQRRFGLQKNFLSKLVTVLKVGPSGPHVGLVQTGDTPRTEVYLSNSTKQLMLAIKELPYLGGDTNTGKAMQHAAEGFFLAEWGARRGHPRVMLVLLDGWPSDDLEQAAGLARDSGINVFLLSVAKPTPEELPQVHDLDYAKKAVCKDNGFFSLSVPSWFSTTKHVRSLSQKICSPDALQCSRTCLNSVNIGFLIDGSSSVGEVNFRLVLDFLTAIAQSFDISDVGSRIGAVQYTYEQRIEFGLSDFLSKEEVVAGLSKIRYMNGGTATGQAINYVTNNLFKPSVPGRNFLIIVTDGQSYDDIGGPAQNAQKHGITVLAVGTAWAPMEDLKAMASQPHDRHTYFSREFSGLKAFSQEVVRAICQDFGSNN
ncbi:cochlin [Gadus morhua]|uniref:cochlin n=1 Tax=Gadus morhua TaxID=8049 RepID=UPI0011B372E9|nr:cochlin [Gadus morhua]